PEDHPHRRGLRQKDPLRAPGPRAAGPRQGAGADGGHRAPHRGGGAGPARLCRKRPCHPARRQHGGGGGPGPWRGKARGRGQPVAGQRLLRRLPQLRGAGPALQTDRQRPVIARADAPRGKKRFVRACRGAPGLEVLLPVERALFARSQPGRFYAGPGLALDVGGPEALAAGGANPEELAAFLQFCGCSALITNGTAPAGWRADGHLYGFALAAGAQLPEPAADEALWAALALDAAPPAGELSAFLYPAGPQRDDYYSALCTKRVRGLARVWALRQGGVLAA